VFVTVDLDRKVSMQTLAFLLLLVFGIIMTRRRVGRRTLIFFRRELKVRHDSESYKVMKL